MDQSLNVKCETFKVLEENRDEHCYYFEIGKDFLSLIFI